jgi:hypothetical protein
MTTKFQCSQEQFLKDAGGHKMTILRDDGVHRHVRFRREQESAYWFDLITWPGTLCIDGDMGTFVFRRLDDMFEFFRTDQDHYNRTGRADQLAINPGYWSQKLRAPTSDAAQEFSPEDFRSRVRERFDEWVQENQPDDEASQNQTVQFQSQRESLESDLEDQVLSMAGDGEIRAFDAAKDFSCADVPDFNLDDCWEWRCREYTFHFLWCCYAIAWGVKTYDTHKESCTA